MDDTYRILPSHMVL